MSITTAPLLGFVAASGTGKTTLLSQLIPLLKQQGLRIGVIKHSHHDFQIDQVGKDSYRLREAGAVTTMLCSPYRRAIITEHTERREPSLHEELQHLAATTLDLILVEGFKNEAFAKIELHRTELNHPLLYPTDSDIIALASNGKLATPSYLTQLDLNQPESIAQFILNDFLRNYARPL